MTTLSQDSSPPYRVRQLARNLSPDRTSRETPLAYPSAILIDGRPYLLPIEPADRCTIGETVAVVSRDEPLKMSVSALPIDKIGRMKPVQLMLALYHEQKANGKRVKKNEEIDTVA